MNQRHDSLWGRRKGKPLSPRRTDLMARRLPGLLVDVGRAAPANLAALFPAPVARFRLEIGFGGGEHLVGEAIAEPGIGHFGVEPFQNGLAKAVAAIDEHDLANVRLFGGDATLLLDWLPGACLDRVDILYPDPWPKRRHWKRRFVSAANLDRLARVIVEGGLLRVATDVPAYADWTLLRLAERSDFDWTGERADDWRKPFPGWGSTRYEQKALAAGRTPAYLAFRRGPLPSPSPR
jgi:tRNA (guanine-N7-)-methyltransferase